MNRRTFLQLAAAAPALSQTAKVPAGVAPGIAWNQWGGPNRNFQTEAAGLKDQWPSGGPKVIWKRPLGEGYSSPAVENNVLYTMYGRSREEVAVACDATTGKTLWEHATPMTFQSDAREMGNGPYSTPLIVGDRLFTTGVAGRLQSIDKKSGKVLWTQQLWMDHEGTHLMYGYASSPIAFRDTVIVPVGGRGKALMAFRQRDGSVAWARNDFNNAFSSPLMINVDGLEQLVVMMDGAVFAVNPLNGDLQWQTPFKASYGIAVATPVWGAGQPAVLLRPSMTPGQRSCTCTTQWASDEGDGGMVVQPAATAPWQRHADRGHDLFFEREAWGSVAILDGGGCAGSGKVLWRERSIPKATFVWADRKLITLDGDGNLMLAHPTPERFKVLARAELLTSLSWTPPALVGTRLYIRDRLHMMAVDLG